MIIVLELIFLEKETRLKRLAPLGELSAAGYHRKY
jgi:hypothetical protein